MSEKKIRVTEQLAHILEQVEIAKDMWLEDDEVACLKLLQVASREMKHVAWEITPILEQ